MKSRRTGAGRVHPQRRYAEARPVAGRVPESPGHEHLRTKHQSCLRALVSPNVISLLPQPEDTTSALMNLTFLAVSQQALRGAVGKIYTLGGDDNAFAHDYHSTVNTALSFNTTLALVLLAYGGSLVILPWDGAASR